MNYSFSEESKVGTLNYSIDMLYIRGYLTCSKEELLKFGDDVGAKYRSFKGRSSYSWFQHKLDFDGCDLYFGYFDEYNKVDKTWSVIDLVEIRYNPNKHSENILLSKFLEVSDSRFITKLDFACDLPLPISQVCCISKKKFSSYNDCETMYYGDWHNCSGRVKIYDKKKELNSKAKSIVRESDLTRIEVTLKPSFFSDESFIKDKFFVMPCWEDISFDDFSDTDKTIMQLFLRLRVYEPSLRIDTLPLERRKKKKLLLALTTSVSLFQIPFNYYLLDKLLELVCSDLNCSKVASRKQYLNDMYVLDDEDLPFDVDKWAVDDCPFGKD